MSSGYRNPLAKLVPSVANEAELEQLKRRAWREEHIMVVRIDDDRLTEFQRELVQMLGEKLYGRNCDR